MAQKPDRFERMVNQNFGVIVSTNPENARLGQYMYREDAVKLLRRQHRAMVRLVHKVWDWQAEQLADNEDACEVIIRELKRYAK